MQSAFKIKRMTRLFYLLGVVMMLTGTLLSMVRVPVLADEPPPVPGEQPPAPEVPALPVELDMPGPAVNSLEEDETVLAPLAVVADKIPGDPSGTLGTSFGGAPAGAPFQFFKATGNPGQGDGDCSYAGGVLTCFWNLPVTEAVNKAADYTTVTIEDGIYAENEIVIAKPVILQAGGNNVVLQNSGVGDSIFEILNTNNVVLIGLTIDGQNVPGIRGVVIIDSSNVTLFDNRIINNETGVLIDGTGTGNVDLALNEIVDNEVGVQIDDAAAAAVRIMENTFYNKTANLVDNSGAGGFVLYDNEWGYIDTGGDYVECTSPVDDYDEFMNCALIQGTFTEGQFVREVPGSGAIWTTNADCGDESQDVNHYSIGDTVFINGANFSPNEYYVWSIEGQPGGASKDPNLYVMGGILQTDDKGAFCIEAYVVNYDDGGEYTVDVGKAKNDNYRVKPRASTGGVTLEIVCGTDGESLLWYVTNGSDENLKIFYSLDDEDYDAFVNVNKGSQALLTSSSQGVHTLYIKWESGTGQNKVMNYLALNSDFLTCRSVQPLTLDTLCNDQGGIDWVINNPNNFDVTVNWTLDTNPQQSGTGTNVPAGTQTTLASSGQGAFTLTVQVATPFQSTFFNLTSDEDTCYTPEALTLSKACELDRAGKPTGRIVWTVNNPNDRDVTFAINDATPVEAGPYSVAANGSTTFTTGNDAALSVTVSFEFDGETYTSNQVTSKEGECEPPVVPQPLTLGYACELVEGRYTGNVIWTVNNPNAFAVQFTVAGIAPVESQPIDVAALGSATFTTADNPGASVTVSFSYGEPAEEFTSEAVSLTAFECTEPRDIYITFYCELDNGNGNGEDVALSAAKLAKLLLPAESIVWHVVNPNPFPVDVEVILDGISQGTFNIPGNSSEQFQTTTGEHTLVANWGDGETTSQTSEIDTCVRPQPLQLTFACIPGASGAISWMVFNPNLVPVELDYFIDQDPPVSSDGTVVVGPGESVEIAITSGGAHLVTVAWLYGGENLLSETSPAGFCPPPGGGGDGDPLPPPGVSGAGGAGGPVLIPVTGADRSGTLQAWFFNLGLVFLGIAFVLTATARRRADPAR